MTGNLDYTCAGCGAEAETVPAPPGGKGWLVMVPHAPSCPVAARLAIMRTRALAGVKR